MVTSITSLQSYYTGDTMKIQFNVSNEGLGEPFHYWWRDRVVSKEYYGIFDQRKLVKIS